MDPVHYQILTQVLGTLKALQKATTSFVMSISLSVCPHGTTRLPLTDFHEI
jgi:hypothetical protein